MSAEEGSGDLGTVCSLYEVRVMCRVTQQELAERLGMTQSMVSRIEKRRDPTLSSLHQYVEALGGELFITLRLAEGVVHYCLQEDSPPSSR